MTEAVVVPPSLFQHCKDVYDKMFFYAAAHRPDEGGADIIVYEGYLTRLITVELRFSSPYYTAITRSLKAMGCIQLLKRGGGTTKSQWRLIHEPTLELFEDGGRSRIPHDADSMLREQVDSLLARVGTLETQIGKVLDHFVREQEKVSA